MTCEKCRELEAELELTKRKLKATEQATQAYYQHVQNLLRDKSPGRPYILRADARPVG